MSLEVGDIAPDFSLKNQFGEVVTLSQFKGKNVVLMFYPFAFTGKCTEELCTIRDERNDFVNDGTQILSISCDPSSSFWPHGQVSKAYGVFLEDLGFANRGTFVIDKTGIIRWKVVTSPGEVRNTADYRLALSAL
jgi:peroxiredoxin